MSGDQTKIVDLDLRALWDLTQERSLKCDPHTRDGHHLRITEGNGFRVRTVFVDPADVELVDEGRTRAFKIAGTVVPFEEILSAAIGPAPEKSVSAPTP